MINNSYKPFFLLRPIEKKRSCLKVQLSSLDPSEEAQARAKKEIEQRFMDLTREAAEDGVI